MFVCRRGTFSAGLFSDKQLSETILISSTQVRGPARVLTPGFDARKKERNRKKRENGSKKVFTDKQRAAKDVEEREEDAEKEHARARDVEEREEDAEKEHARAADSELFPDDECCVCLSEKSTGFLCRVDIAACARHARMLSWKLRKSAPTAARRLSRSSQCFYRSIVVMSWEQNDDHA